MFFIERTSILNNVDRSIMRDRIGVTLVYKEPKISSRRIIHISSVARAIQEAVLALLSLRAVTESIDSGGLNSSRYSLKFMVARTTGVVAHESAHPRLEFVTHTRQTIMMLWNRDQRESERM